MKKAIRLYLLTGFLGSGKTSVINSLLSQIQGKKVGLILNDFGSIPVDSALIDDTSKIAVSTNLNGGQIFCSCLSGSFIKSVTKMAEYDLDYILVEASGLSKPTSLLEIVSAITSQETKHRVVYGGMACVVDAQRYLILSQSLMTITEQVVCSDWFIINKSDLVDEQLLQSTISHLTHIKPLTPIYTTSFGKVTPEIMSQFENQGELTPQIIKDSKPYRGWGSYGRPKSCIFIPQMPFEIPQIEGFFTSIAVDMLRVKGFLDFGEKTKALLVDIVGNQVKIGVVEKPHDVEMGVVCVYSASTDAVSLLKQRWTLLGKSPSICVEH
jgi:G3E family GTPase